jgi:two-component system, cell cycle sensor histidine kinase and response regulator CckA
LRGKLYKRIVKHHGKSQEYLMANQAVGLARERPESRESLEEHLLAHKAEIVGELAGAIAHRFNNIMMAVSSYAELELKKATPQQKRNLEQVLGNIAQATSLVQKLITLSRKRQLSPQPMSLNSLVTGLSSLLQQLCGEGFELILDLSPKTRAIQADHIEIEQLILSLVVNVRSLTGVDGRVTIASDLAQLGQNFFEPCDTAVPGEYVMLSVRGTGPGPTNSQGGDAERQNHSTLAAASAIVKHARGLVRAPNEAENSRTCTVYFPALGQAVAEGEEKGKAPKSLEAAKTILVVDDDDAVRVPAAEFLKMEGFKVLQAKTGPEALQIAERHHGSLDLVATDIIMPEMSGREVAETLRELYPHIKVLYMSGDSETAPFLKELDPAHAPLQKPFRLTKLNERILELLGR